MDQKDENQTTTELDVNRKNREDYEELMKNSSTQTDDYWDKDNPFIKVLLIVLGIIIVVGVLYYIISFANR